MEMWSISQSRFTFIEQSSQTIGERARGGDDVINVETRGPVLPG